MNKYIVSLLIFSTFLLLASCSFTSQKKETGMTDFELLQEKGKIVFVTNYSHQDYYVKGDTVEGFNYSLVQYLKDYTDLNIEIKLESSLQKSIEGLEVGSYHVIARNVPITTELKDKVLFTTPIAKDRQVLVQLKEEYNDQPLVRSHLDLAGKTLYVSKDSPAILRINNLSKEIASDIHYIEDEVYTGEQLAIMVAKGEIDYAVCSEKVAKRIQNEQPELDIATMIGFTQLEGWVVGKDSPVLLDSLNSWLKKLEGTKKFKLLYKKYYP